VAKIARILTAEDSKMEAEVIQDLSMPADPLIQPDNGKNVTKRKTKMKATGRIPTQSL
jgi:hypothetical protein